ncbi:MAG: hypothetical protein H8E55_08155 [Pelagibacterales bacterium]|nr:hypothetical protein [Pelagibacterales bacterium]
MNKLEAQIESDVANMELAENVFFLDGFEGIAQGGIFVRNDLFKLFEKINKSGKKVVGIKVDDTWNLEVLIEKEEKR